MGEMKKVLIVDDEASLRHMLRLVLTEEGYSVLEAENGTRALEVISKSHIHLVLCDIRMPGMDGITFLNKARHLKRCPTIIMMSAYGTIDTAIECMKQGAYDYISKPFKPDEVILTIKKAEERLQLATENEFLRQELSGKKNGKKIVYRSKAMEHILELVEKVAASSSTVLVTGETGTGKELVARALHAGGGRNKGPFVPLNCGAISPGLMESELFGHVRGAFTGADRDKQGLFAAADKGTLFLDEIGELPMELQPKLLRALQDGEIMQVGGTKTRKADVRVLAATARDLKEELEKGRFRDDFYYRLAVVEIHIPPLRERKEDIQVLAEHFIKKIAAREQRPVPTLAEDALDVLHSYHWPGNVRELENLMEKTMIFCREETIDSSSLPWETRRKRRVGEESYSLKQATKRIEKEFIHKALAATEGNRTQAAGLLEISLRSLLYKLKEYNIS